MAETRRLESTIYRARCCADCGLKFVTEEVVLPGAKIPYEAIKAWHERIGFVKKTRNPHLLRKVRPHDKDFDF